MVDFQVVCGEALEELRNMPDASVDLILTDPPYFKVRGEQWDNQWDTPQGFIDWLSNIAEEWARVLKPNGSLFVFASVKMSARVELMLSEVFRVVNCIRWDKIDGDNITRRQKLSSLRSFAPSSESIVFCEHRNSDNWARGEASYVGACDNLRGDIFAPLRKYLDSERSSSGWTVRQVAEEYQKKTGSRTVTGMAGHWFGRSQWALPTHENYVWLRGLFGEGFLRREYEDLRREYEDLRRPFELKERVNHGDVWRFKAVPPGSSARFHVCEKPQDMLRHIIETTTKRGAVVLDTFMGAGSTGVAALSLDRSFIGVEMNQDYCAAARSRLSEVGNALL